MCHDVLVTAVAALVDTWRAARAVTVLTGAGISTDSGLPDFRGPEGLWTTMPGAEAMFDISVYVSDPQVRKRAWANRRASGAWTARPNQGHLALADLQRAGQVHTLLTQNIDGLHQQAGSVDVVELHGTIWEVACLSCAARWPAAVILDRAEPDPLCEYCGGLLKSATVSFGQALDPQVIGAALDATRDCDLLVAVGTSLQVNPVAMLAGLAEQLAIVNAEPTPYDDVAEVVVRAPISEVLGRVRGVLA